MSAAPTTTPPSPAPAAPSARSAARGGRRRERPGRRRPAAVVRSLVAGSGLVVRRRARRDLLLLLALAALVATSTLLSVAGPRLVLQTVDAGARDAVQRAGARGDLTFTTPTGDGAGLSSSELRVSRTEAFVELVDALPDRLPEELRAVAGASVATALGPETIVVEEDGAQESTLDEDGEVRVELAMLTDDVLAELELVDGELPAARQPAASGAPVQVVVSAAGAEAASLAVGSELVLGLRSPVTGEIDSHAATVVGVVEPTDPGARVWQTLPEVVDPTFRAPVFDDRPPVTSLTLLAAPDGVTASSAALATPFTGIVSLAVDPERVTTDGAARLGTEIEALRANTAPLAEGLNASLTLATDLDDTLQAYPTQARAALAQMSVVIAGVIGVGGVVVVLLARLLVVRRSGAVALERARGASVAAVGLRLLAESLLVALLGAAVGLGLAQLLLPGSLTDPAPAAAVVVVAVLASPLQGMWLARGAWTGRREPANRQDRAQLAKRRRARRVVLEAGAVALAAAALLSLRGRGLLQDQTRTVDPFLAAAPLLLAIAVTVVVLRLYPWPVRAAGVVGRRGRGVLGLLGAVRAERAVAPLPLLALTLGVALAVGGGLLVGTVRDGQTEASWQRVGADVRITSDDAAALAEELRAAPGVTGVGVADVAGSISVKLGATSELVTVLAVDQGYRDLVADLGQDVTVADPDGDLAALVDADGDAVPMVVDASLADRVAPEAFAMFYGPDYVELALAGSTRHAPAGWLEGPFAYVDLATVDAGIDLAVEGDTVLVVGPGAQEAVDALGLPADAVVSRAQWLDARRGLPLLAGVERMMVLAVVATLALAVVALVATVLAGARERGRALAMLRTLGMAPRLGWWLALAELAPVVLAALVGGSAAGVAIVVLLAPALGLDVLAGGLSVPAPSLSPTVLLGLAGGAVLLLVLAVLAEVLAHRRDRLSEVLRVGETV